MPIRGIPESIKDQHAPPFSFGDGEDAAFYRIYCGQDGVMDYETPVAVMALDDESVEIPDQDLPSETVWHYIRRKVMPCGLESPDSPVCIVAIDESGDMIGLTPNPPLDVNIEQLAGAKLKLNWRYSLLGQEVVPTGFKIYMDSGSGFDYETPVTTLSYLGGGSEFSWTSSALTNGQLYRFIVRSYYSSGGESRNDDIVAAYADSAGPSAVSGLFATWEDM